MKYLTYKAVRSKLTLLALILIFNLSLYAQIPEWNIVYNGNLKEITFIDEYYGFAIKSNSFVKTTDGGYNWDVINFGVPQFTPQDIIAIGTDIALCFADKWIFKTNDGGSTWKTIIDNGYAGKKNIYYSGNNTLWGFSPAGDIISSDDLGESWTLKYDAPDASLTNIEFCDTRTGWATGDPFITGESNTIKTTDGGKSWFKIDPPFNKTDFIPKKIKFIDENNGFCLFYNAGIGKTTDQGKTWVQIYPQNASDLSVFKPNGVWASLYYESVKSKDGGTTWSKDSLGGYSYEITAVDSSLAYVSGLYHGIYTVLYKYNKEIVIPDRSESIWKKSLLGYEAEFNDVSFVDDNIGWCSLSGTPGKLYKTTNGGVTWFKLYQSNTPFTSIHFFSKNDGYATTYGESGKLLKTTDGGFSWLFFKMNVPTKMYFRQNKGFLYGKQILMSNDFGENWNSISPYLPSFSCNDIYFADDNTGWFCGKDPSSYNSMLFKTTDGGVSWTKLYESTAGEFTNVIGFADSDTLYITYFNVIHGIRGTTTLKSKDGGSTWVKIPGTGGDAIHFTSPQKGWVAEGDYTNSARIKKTTDGGVTWNTELEDNTGRFRKMYFLGHNAWILGPGRMLNNKDRSIIEQVVLERSISDTTISQGEEFILQLSASGYPRPGFRLIRAPFEMKIDAVSGVINWNCDIPGTHNVGVEAFNNYSNQIYNFTITVTPESVSSESFKLFQNYPNPFNLETIIKYRLSQTGFVSLKLFDILGREVFTIVSKEQPSGEYHVAVNGSSLSSGLYIYRLQSGGFVDSKKLMMIK